MKTTAVIKHFNIVNHILFSCLAEEKSMRNMRSVLSIISLTVVFVTTTVFVTPSMAVADGTHGSKVCVRNSTPKALLIYSYNAKDSSCLIPHKSKKASSGETVTMKCHGQGKNACKLGTSYLNTNDSICKRWDNNALVVLHGTVFHGPPGNRKRVAPYGVSDTGKTCD